ncbi:MAG TPA: VanZ family protein [Terriglobales bacterium]|nr:VanZ family protein [Terriglobales bacterium]
MAAVCAAIFLLSRDSNSGRHSAEVLSWFLWLFHAATPERIAAWNEPFRKLCHFSVYLILGLITYRALALDRGPRFRFSSALGSLLFVFLYASSDELHQSFVPGRGVEFSDVLLDTLGAAIGLAILWFYLSRRYPQQPTPPHPEAALPAFKRHPERLR